MLYKVLRYGALAILAISGLILGYIRWTYALVYENGFKFIARNKLSKQYPLDWSSLKESIISDPRWISTIFYFICPFLLSIGSVYLFFLNKKFVKTTITVYLLCWGLLCCLTLISISFTNYSIGLGLAQNLKHLLQTPFFTLFLIAAFQLNTMNTNSPKNNA